MTRHYPDLGSASDWSCRVGNLIQPIRSTTQIWVVMRHQYGISALVSQTSFGGETRGSIAKCQLFSQATSLYNNLDSESSPDHLQSSTSPLLLSHCSCSAGCSTKRCSCVRENIKCQDCRCGAPCKNPLNIMAEFGVDVDRATSDLCLMQKLPKVCSMSDPLIRPVIVCYHLFDTETLVSLGSH